LAVTAWKGGGSHGLRKASRARDHYSIDFGQSRSSPHSRPSLPHRGPKPIPPRAARDRTV